MQRLSLTLDTVYSMILHVAIFCTAPAPTYIAKSAAKKDKKSRNDKRKITKDEISGPSDFRHVNHVGWDPNSGFDVSGFISAPFCTFLLNKWSPLVYICINMFEYH